MRGLKDWSAIKIGSKAINSVYEGLTLVWIAVSKYWRRKDIWKRKELW